MLSVHRRFPAGSRASVHPAETYGAPGSPPALRSSASHPLFEGLGRPPARDVLRRGSNAVVEMPGSASSPTSEAELSPADKRRAVVATVASGTFVGACSSGLANKLPSVLLQVSVGSLAGEFAGDLAGAAGNLIGYPSGAFVNRHGEAATVKVRLALAKPVNMEGRPDRPSRWAGVDHVPMHPFHNRDLWVENISTGVSAAAGALKGMVKAVLPAMHPAVGAVANLGVDFGFSALSHLTTQILQIAKNPEERPMLYKKITFAPNPPDNSNATHLFDGETRDRLWSSMRSSGWATTCDLTKALLERPAADAGELGKNVAGLGLLNAVKDGTTQYAYNQGRRTEAGARSRPEPDRQELDAAISGLRLRRRSSTMAAMASATVEPSSHEIVIGRAQTSHATRQERMEAGAMPPGTYVTVIRLTGNGKSKAE
jgi:hypothetical protein